MHLIQLLFISLAGLSVAANVEDACITVQGTDSVKPVPTVMHTDKETRTTYITKFQQAHTTITPKTVTRTAKKTTVVNVNKPLRRGTSKITVTYYTTSTISLPRTTVTLTKTITTSVTTRTAVTVPTPTGFKPIQDSLSDATYFEGAPGKRDAAAEQQEQRKIHFRSPLVEERDDEPSAVAYPQKVDCESTQIVPKTVFSTATLTTLTITANTPIRTITSVQKITRTKTLVRAGARGITTAKTTKVIKATVTPRTTITKTATTTVALVKIPGPTTYAVCESANFANSKSEEGAFVSYRLGFGGPVISSSAANPRDCCAACAANYACVGFFFGEACALIKNDGTCSDSEPCSGSVQFNAEVDRHLFVMGNGGGFQWNSYVEDEPATS